MTSAGCDLTSVGRGLDMAGRTLDIWSDADLTWPVAHLTPWSDSFRALLKKLPGLRVFCLRVRFL